MDNLKDYMTPLSKKIRDLEALGYTAQFQWEGKSLKNTENNQQYNKEDLQISHKYRFEGPSNPSDEAILYALDTHDGNKGTLVNAYGLYADSALEEFLQGVPDKSDPES